MTNLEPASAPANDKMGALPQGAAGGVSTRTREFPTPFRRTSAFGFRVEENVWFRPLLMCVSRGYWMNLLKVCASPASCHGIATPCRSTVSCSRASGAISNNDPGRARGWLRLRGARRDACAGWSTSMSRR